MHPHENTLEAANRLIAELTPYCGSISVSMPGESFDALVGRLLKIRELARIDERELGAYRRADLLRETVEQAAGSVLDGGETSDKIIRPDFGGKRS